MNQSKEMQKEYVSKLKKSTVSFLTDYKKRYNLFPWRTINKVKSQLDKDATIVVYGNDYTIGNLIKEISKLKVSIDQKLKVSYFAFVYKNFLRDSHNKEENYIKELYNQYDMELKAIFKEMTLNLEFCLDSLKEINKMLKDNKAVKESTAYYENKVNSYIKNNHLNKDFLDDLEKYYKASKYKDKIKKCKLMTSNGKKKKDKMIILGILDSVNGSYKPILDDLSKHVKFNGETIKYYSIYFGGDVFLSVFQSDIDKINNKYGSKVYKEYANTTAYYTDSTDINRLTESMEVFNESLSNDTSKTKDIQTIIDSLTSSDRFMLNYSKNEHKFDDSDTVKEIVEYDKGIPVAYFAVDIYDDFTANVSFAVRPDYRSRGYGNNIVKEGTAWIKSHLKEFTEVFWATKANNKGSQVLAEKNGWKVVRDDKTWKTYSLKGTKKLVNESVETCSLSEYERAEIAQTKFKEESEDIMDNELLNTIIESYNDMYDLYEEGANSDTIKETRNFIKSFKQHQKDYKVAFKKKDFENAKKAIEDTRKDLKDTKDYIKNLKGDSITSAIAGTLTKMLIDAGLTMAFSVGLNVVLNKVNGTNASTKEIVKKTVDPKSDISTTTYFVTIVQEIGDVVKTLQRVYKDKKNGEFNAQSFNALRTDLLNTLDKYDRICNKWEIQLNKLETIYKQQVDKVLNDADKAKLKEEKVKIYTACKNGEITIEEREELIKALNDKTFIEKSIKESVKDINSTQNEIFESTKKKLYKECADGTITIDERENLINKAHDTIFSESFAQTIEESMVGDAVNAAGNAATASVNNSLTGSSSTSGSSKNEDSVGINPNAVGKDTKSIEDAADKSGSEDPTGEVNSAGDEIKSASDNAANALSSATIKTESTNDINSLLNELENQLFSK